MTFQLQNKHCRPVLVINPQQVSDRVVIGKVLQKKSAPRMAASAYTAVPMLILMTIRYLGKN
jgi:hypothetical protein